MSLKYKKIGATTGGYRGERAVLKERVIEGLVQPLFTDGILQLTPDSQQTQYLTTSNTSTGFFIVLPSGLDLWNNWQVAIVNNSASPVNIYYYTSDPTNSNNLHLFKELGAGNMLTAILLDNTTEQGTWTTLRTSDTASGDSVDKFTTNVFETFTIRYNQLQGQQYFAYVPEAGSGQTTVYTTDNPIGTTSILYNSSLQALDPQPAYTLGEEESIIINNIIYTRDETADIIASSVSSLFNLSAIPVGTAVRSIYFKPSIQFTGSTITMSIGTTSNPTLFYNAMDISGAVADNYFTKDMIEEIISTSSDTQLIATFAGSNLNNLTAGEINIVIEKAKLVDPTILKNAIVNTNIPIGSIFNYAFPDVPVGYQRLDGTEIANAAEVIPQFVEYLVKMNNRMTGGQKLIVGIDEWNTIKRNSDTDSCGKFAWNGTALRFPCINCLIKGAGNHISTFGKFVDEGLPNITGKATGNIQGHNWGWSSEGALEWIDSRGDASWEDNTTGYTGIKFDASKSNAIYGRSNHVTPKHILYPYIMSVFSKVQWTSQEDYDALINASIYKANTDLSNVINASSNFKEMTTDWMMPDYNSVISQSSGISYTAQCNGWLFININAFTSSTLTYNGENISLTRYDDSAPQDVTVWWPVSKGDIYSLTSANIMRFYPLKGVTI